jgi:hypothetical protein
MFVPQDLEARMTVLASVSRILLDQASSCKAPKARQTVKCGRVSWDSEPRITVLARASSNLAVSQPHPP